MTGDLKAKHVDWNSRLGTRTGKLLRDYSDDNSRVIFRTDTQTTNPHNPCFTPDVLEMVITQNLTSPVYLTSCNALRSDDLPVLIQTACRSSFQHPSDRPDFSALNWQNSKLTCKTKFHSIRNCTKVWQSTRTLRTYPAPF
jgi:hypothetical protein